MELRDIISSRRSYYGLGRDVDISEGEIIAAVEDAVRFTPSAYNSQSQRVAVMLGPEHEALWNITEAALRKKIGDQRYAGATEEKISRFRSAYGTVLFFDDMTKTCEMGNRFPSNVGNFPIWAQQASGMLQFAVWMVLEDMGLGASLQHYNPLIDAQVQERWSLPSEWKLIAQMPFGSVVSPAGEKSFEHIRDRVKVFGGQE
jgi:predicted oxidoreductase (fatty acid repression mutant protein)